MKTKTQKLTPDIILKNYWRNNEQFADLFNAVLFHGEERIRPSELTESDTEESSILEHKESLQSIKASRDNIRICKKSTALGAELVLLGLEHQEHIHYAMPMRIMGYDYAAYKKQYDINAKNYKKRDGLSEDEFLSKMKATDKFIPVISIVIYYGEKDWDGAKSLHDMLSIPKELTHYVTDYKIHLIEAKNNQLLLHNENNQNLFQLLQLLLDKNLSKRQKEEKIVAYHTEYNIDKTVAMTVAGITNTHFDYRLFEKEDGTMISFWREVREEGEQIGIQKGRASEIVEMGFEFGLSESDILERLQKKLDISLQMAQEYLAMFGKQMI